MKSLSMLNQPGYIQNNSLVGAYVCDAGTTWKVQEGIRTLCWPREMFSSNDIWRHNCGIRRLENLFLVVLRASKMTDMSSSFCFLGVRANSGGAGFIHLFSSSAFTVWTSNSGKRSFYKQPARVCSLSGLSLSNMFKPPPSLSILLAKKILESFHVVPLHSLTNLQHKRVVYKMTRPGSHAKRHVPCHHAEKPLRK